MLKDGIKGTAFLQQRMWNLISVSCWILPHSPSMLVSPCSVHREIWMLRFRCDGSIEQGVFPHKQRERLSAASKFWLAQAHQTVPLYCWGLGCNWGISCTYSSNKQDLCVCVSVPPDINPVMISLLEQVEKGKCLPVPGVSGTLKRSDDSAEAGRGPLVVPHSL